VYTHKKAEEKSWCCARIGGVEFYPDGTKVFFCVCFSFGKITKETSDDGCSFGGVKFKQWERRHVAGSSTHAVTKRNPSHSAVLPDDESPAGKSFPKIKCISDDRLNKTRHSKTTGRLNQWNENQSNSSFRFVSYDIQIFPKITSISTYRLQRNVMSWTE
jgi:hypothetical protein